MEAAGNAAKLIRIRMGILIFLLFHESINNLPTMAPNAGHQQRLHGVRRIELLGAGLAKGATTPMIRHDPT